jgi:hypothetical protein
MDSLTAGELAKRAKRQPDARIRARILAICSMRLGHTIPEAANALGMSGGGLTAKSLMYMLSRI